MFRSGRMIGHLTGLVNRIVSLAVAVLIVTAVLKPSLFGFCPGTGEARGIVPFLYRHRFCFLPVAVVLLVLDLNLLQFLAYMAWNSREKRFIPSRTTSGSARVSLDALERSLQAAARGVPEISRCRLRVFRVGARRYKVEVQFWIPEAVNVVNISEKLRLVLKKRFSELVSVEPGDQVFFEITLAGIRRRKGAAPFRGDGGRSGPDRRLPFTGPVYPVEGDG